MKTVAIIIARMGSSRLPGKVLMNLAGRPTLSWVVGATKASSFVDEVWVATSTLPVDDAIKFWCLQNGTPVFRGDETDVLSRFYGCAVEAAADVVVRVTGDCPFIDPRVLDEVIMLRESGNFDYASNIDPPTFADGLDCEVMTTVALGEANAYATRPSDRNTVTQYILRNRASYKTANLTCPIPGMVEERWVLDTENDLKLCQKIAENTKSITPPSYLDIKAFLDRNPELRSINKMHPRNERFFAELTAEEPVKRSHAASKLRLALTEEVIPLGAQTYSKSKLQYPVEAPLFVTHGNGGLVYDVDGNDYVDLVGGLLPNILGHRDSDVDSAIRAQLDRGISFSVATPLEFELAQKLTEIIPCAEMVRFGKSGTDVTSAAVRLARYATGSDKILSSGYHGWADWTIAHDKTRSGGVPMDVQRLTTIVRHGDTTATVKALETREYACCILEPETDPEYLRAVRAACNYTGTPLVFDEIITGFRFGLGGAQELYGVKPDLATFGKAMANGMPISALVGRAEYMKHMDKVCFSGTFFGEALSIAAAIATINKLEAKKVPQELARKNMILREAIRVLRHDYGEFIDVHGEHLMRIKFLAVGGMWTAEDVKTLFMQEMIKNGVLIIASHNWSYAHNDEDLRRVVKAYEAAFKVMAKAVREGQPHQYIKGRSVSSTANVRAS